MPLDTEEQQAREFLQRVEIRTMKKDLRALRESDAIKEKEKIEKIETPEEIALEQGGQVQPSETTAYPATQTVAESTLAKGANELRATENSLKSYATEAERQQIFALETERSDLEKSLNASTNKSASTDEAQKNRFLSSKDGLQKRLVQIVESQRKLESEQKFVLEQAQKASDPLQKSNFEKASTEFDEQIKSLEKQRWPIEREIKELEDKIAHTNESLKKIVLDINNSRQRIGAINVMLRNTYAKIISRVEAEKAEKIRVQPSTQDLAKQALQERIQREKQSIKELNLFKNKEVLNKIPSPYKENLDKSATSEEQARKQFLSDVEEGAKRDPNQGQQNNSINPSK